MFNALALISVLVVIVMLKTIVSIIPSVMACVIWWKENINVESSVKLSRNRNLSAAVLYLPFCLTAFRFRLYNPEFMDRMPDNARLWTMIGIFTLYCLLRYTATRLVRPQSIPVKTYVAADRSSYTFFILLTLLLPTLGILGTVVAVNLQKKTHSFVGSVTLLFVASTALTFVVLALISSASYLVLTVGIFGIVSCLMAGVNNIITSMVPLSLKSDGNSGKIAGILNGFCYLGSTLSSYGLGVIADAFGWGAVFVTLLGVSIFVILIGGAYVLFKKKNKT